MKKNRIHIGRVLLLILLLAGSWSARPVRANVSESLLQALDRELDRSNMYVEERRRRIRLLRDMQRADASREQRYMLNRKLYDEYYSFKFDSALICLMDNLQLAHELRDRRREQETQIELGMLYTTAGMYLEAMEVLTTRIDTLTLDRTQTLRYYCVQQRFHRDYNEYMRHHTLATNAPQRLSYYRSQLFASLPPGSDGYLELEVDDAITRGEMERADSVNAILLTRYPPDSHPYAIQAYVQAIISFALGRDDYSDWYIRSATADVMTATKDNASLVSLARELFGQQDIQRAFRYVLISMDDALFYNARLRPWQVAQIMPVIEKSYTEHTQAAMRMQYLAIIAVGVSAVLLLLLSLYAYAMLRRTRRTAQEIRHKNEQISDINAELHRTNNRLRGLNAAIVEANGVKEEYIGLLLSMCSNYIEKMLSMQRAVKRKLAAGRGAELQKELSSSTLIDAELNDFYEMFDNAFLKLYPDFVEEFNSLLKDDERIYPAKEERLNTELRIFALIRLGITDSSRIAALLRYSVNTIYNYRAKIKTKSKYGRDDFENMIRTIGSFKA